MPLPPLVRQLVEIKLAHYCERKVSDQLKDLIRLKFKIRGTHVTLIEARPHWSDPSEWTELKVAQFRYDPAGNQWSLFCSDRNEKWLRYIDLSPSPRIDDLLEEIDDDPIGIFWG